ncbi:MAG: choice-of-anchor Q domain-containing protein [Terriglobia bacterium]
MRLLPKGLLLAITLAGLVLGYAMPAAGSAANIYIAQSAVGAADGADCNDAYAYTFFNTASNWGSGSTQIGPGTTVHLCGTITVPLNNSGLIVQGSGTSSSPITIKFETGAILQSAAFNGCANGPVGGSFSAGGGIEIDGYNYIIVDGGTNGIIQNTANGTGLANSQCSLGIEDKGDYNIIRNLTITNIYVNQGSGSGATDTAGGSTADIYENGAVNFMQICNNYFGQAHTGAEMHTAGASTTPGTTFPACSSNAFTSNSLNFFGNTVYDHGWSILAQGTGAPNYYNNNISYWTDWFYPSDYHQDGIMSFNGTAATLFLQIFNNYFHGDIGGASPSGMLYLAETDLADGSGQSANVFNNVFYGTGGSVTCCMLVAADQTHSNPKGPYGFYNNTFVNSEYMYELYDNQISPVTAWENNIFYVEPSSWIYQKQNGSPYSFASATFQGNDYFGGRSSGTQSQAFQLYLGSSVDFSTWKSDCVSGGGTGCDSASVTTDPKLAGESSFASGGTLTTAGFRLQAGSPAIGLGTNLTSLCSSIPALCYDAAGNQRPTTGAWDAGAYEYQATATGPTPPTVAPPVAH